MKVLLLAKLVRNSKAAVPVLLRTVRLLLARVTSLTETAEMVPLKLVVGVKVRPAVLVAVTTTVWVALAPKAGLDAPPIPGVTVLVDVVLPATVKVIW